MALSISLHTARAVPARLAVAMRRAVFVPDGPLESFYQRRIRPWGRKLLPPPQAARPGRVVVHASPAAPPLQVREILVVKLDHIGDFVLAAPAFATLRRAFPDARITLLCGPWNRRMAESSGWFDRVIPFRFFARVAEADRPTLDQALLAAIGPFDLAIDLRVDDDTRHVLRLIRATCTAGYEADLDLTITLPRPALPLDPGPGLAAHTRQRLLDLVAAILAHDFGRETEMLVRRAAREPAGLALRRPVVAFNTGSGRAIKNWPLDRYIMLGRNLLARGATILLLGGAEQVEDAARIRAELSDPNVVDYVGRLPLEASLGALAGVDAYVGNDTALGHAAAAMGKVTVVLFGGIDPLAHWAPLGPNAVAIKTEIACAPCHLSDLALCPNGHGCMTAISVGKVWDVLAARLPWTTPTQAPKARLRAAS